MAIVLPTSLASWTYAAGFRGADWTNIVAVGIAQGANPSATGGVWGVGPKDDGPAQAKAAFVLFKKSGLDAFAAGKSGWYRLYLPAAIAATGAVAVQVETSAAASGVADAGKQAASAGAAVGDVAAQGASVLSFAAGAIRDPIFYQSVAYFLIGSAVITVGLFMLFNRGAIQPVLNSTVRGIQKTDRAADIGREFHTNVVRPLGEYRRARKAERSS